MTRPHEESRDTATHTAVVSFRMEVFLFVMPQKVTSCVVPARALRALHVVTVTVLLVTSTPSCRIPS